MKRSQRPLPYVLSAVCAATVALSGAGTVFAQASFKTQEYLNQKGLDVIKAADAYALGYTGRGITIGIVDSGIVAWHPEFAGQILGGYDFMLNQPVSQSSGTDTDGHGSHVNGIMAARRDGVGMHGVAFNARLFSSRYGADDDDDDDDDETEDFDIGSGATFIDKARVIDPVFGTAWNYMARQKLVVINNSVGFNDCADGASGDALTPCNITNFSTESGATFNPDTLFPQTISALRALKDAGTLMVFATGNEQQQSPDFLAGAPHLYSDLKDNWLAVTAIDVDDLERAEYANACGVAKTWCLAAPGSLTTDGDWEGIWSVGKDGGYVQMPGTSMAAPHVTGAVALVKEAFPFFDAYQLQQTILTTATDLGNAGVDIIYGWGLLNVGKAVRGPAKFNGIFKVDTRGYTGTFSNDIADGVDADGTTSLAGSLEKNGAGTLILSGNNTYSGSTTVNGGTLRIDGTNQNSNATVNGGELLVSPNGTLNAPQTRVDGGKLVVNGKLTGDTTIASAGTLAGAGTLVGNVTNNGIVAPGNSPGTLTINGNYTSGAGSVLQMEVDGSAYDRLVVTGDATINGTLQLLGGPYRQGQNYDFLQVNGATTLAGGASGFSAIDTRLLFLSPNVNVSGGTFSLSVNRNSVPFTRYLNSSNQQAVATALDPLSSSPPAALSAVYDDLLNATADTFPGLVDQLSGEGYASLESSLFSQSTQWTQSVSDRLYQTQQGAQNDAHSPMWVSVQRQWTNLNGSAGTAETRSISNGLYMGGDTALAAGWRAGFAFGAHEGRIRTDQRATRTDSNSYTASAYAGKQWQLGNNTSLSWNSGAAYTYHDLDTLRDLTVGAGQRLNADHRAHQTQVFTELGYSLAVRPGLRLQPYARADWNMLKNTGFTESGGAAALRSGSQSNTVTSLTLGLRSQHQLELDKKALHVSADLGWRNNQGDLSPSRTMQFTQGVDTAFTVNGVPLARNTLLAGLDAHLNVGKSAVAGVSYKGQFGGGNTSNAARLYLNIRF